MIKILNLILFCALTCQLASQSLDMTDFEEQYVTTVNRLWQNVEEQEDVVAYEALVKKYENYPDFFWIIKKAGLVTVDSTFTIDSFQLEIEKKFHEIAEELTPVDLEIILDNPEISSILSDGVVRHDGAFHISFNSLYLDETYLYEFSNDSIILEIGGGSGINGLLWANMYPNGHYYINEIDTKKLNLIDSRIRFHNGLLVGKLSTIEGSKTTTGFQGIADKIILRNTFHHLTHRKELLNDIKSKMSDQSVLIINESIKSNCEDHISISKVRRIMRKNKFKLIDTKRVKRRVLLFYQKKN